MLKKNNTGIADNPWEMVLPNSNVCVTPEEAETIRSGNAEVLKVHVLKTTGRRKRSEYRHYAPKQRAKIAKWACDFGNISAVRHFTSEFGKPINESTVRFMKKQYLHEVDSKPNKRVTKLYKSKRGKLSIHEENNSKIKVG